MTVSRRSASARRTWKRSTNQQIRLRSQFCVEPLGSQNLLTIQIGSDIIKVSTHPDFRAAMNTDIWIRFPSDKIRWIDRDTGKAIMPDLEQLAAYP
jgi:hypothetical protein